MGTTIYQQHQRKRSLWSTLCFRPTFRRDASDYGLPIVYIFKGAFHSEV